MNELGKMPTMLKTGNECLTLDGAELKHSLLDFWKWSVSDILSNATRGRFAKFIIATAMGIDTKQVREEWGNFDLETSEGIKIEVKSAAYIQSWSQKTFSKISFNIKEGYFWDDIAEQRSAVAGRTADVYAFCLLHHINKKDIDPLNLSQWEFYVMNKKQLNAHAKSTRSITLTSLRKLTEAVSYQKLSNEIKLKYAAIE